MNLIKKTLASLTFLILLTATGYGESDLDRGRALLSEGNYGGAVESYAAWMSAHQNDTDYAMAANEISPYIVDLDEKRAILERALFLGPNPELRRTLLKKLATAEVQAGLLTDAQRRYLEASFSVPGDKDLDSLLQAAILAYELGSLDDAEALSRIVVETGKETTSIASARLLLSRVYHATDRIDQAFALILDDGAIGETATAPTLYWLYQMSILGNRGGLADETKARLESQYPETLECALVRGEVRRVPAGSYLYELLDSDGEGSNEDTAVKAYESPSAVSSAESTESVIEPVRSASIQTGSFTVRENAEYAAADLSNEGFASKIEEKIVNGTLYYRVVVPDISDEKLDRTILELKEKGFEGFLIYE